MRRTPGFSDSFPGFSGPTRTVLMVLAGLFVAQLVLGSWLHLPVVEMLGWWHVDSESFRLWQPITSLLLSPADPLDALFSWLVVLFLMPACASSFGWGPLWRGLGGALVAAALMGLLLQTIGVVLPGRPYVGIAPALTALTVIFGLSRPNATLLLFFVLPVRAAWVAWGTGILFLLGFLASRSMDTAMGLTGWCAAWLWLNGFSLRDLRRPYLRWKQARVHRRLRSLQVIEGGRSQQRSSRDDGPLYH